MLQYQSQTIRPLTTAHLAQTMSLLEMTSDELLQKIEGELAQNPALELVEERRCPTCKRTLVHPGPCPMCSRPTNPDYDEPIVFLSSNEDYAASGSSQNYTSNSTSVDEFPDDNLSNDKDLPSYVLEQIASELAVEDRLIAAHILSSLDEDGLLLATPFEISRYHHVPISRVENILRLIQKADPIGVGSPSVESALLIQLEVLQERGEEIHPLTRAAIQKGMNHLSKHRYKELGKQLGISLEESKAIAQFISSNLNPYPARAHWGNIHQGNNSQPQAYHKPDIIVRKIETIPTSPLVVEIIIPTRGTLRVNPLFRKMIKDAPAESIDKWKSDLENANLLIKCLQQRNNTMQRLMGYVANRQREFILKGKKFLHPTTRAQVAEELGVHESTISRAVSGKNIQLPNGRIIPLKQFFDPSLHLRAHLLEIIQEEKTSLTDSQIASMLSQRGFKVARRTVAKYRAMEGILPAHMRKHLAHQPAK